MSNFIYNSQLNEVAVLTPEYGKFMKIGGLAVIIEDLCEEISRFGTQFHVLMPYFNENLKGETDYMKSLGVKYWFKICFDFHGMTYEIGVHTLKEGNINFYFLHNFYLFPKIY